MLLPGKHGDDGWYGYRTSQHTDVQRDIYLYTFDKTHLEGIDSDPWIRYLSGDNPNYPAEALRGDLESIRRRVTGLKKDNQGPEQRTSDYPQRFNPAQADTLTELMLGANPPGRSGNVLHARLLYYDPDNQRVGLPADVGSLVSKITPEGLTVELVNLHQVEPRTVIVKAGAYGEHQFKSVRSGGERLAVNGSAFEIELAPGAGGKLEIEMELLANPPKMGFPW